jgi:L-aminopeptidase/D-esterase-like protein
VITAVAGVRVGHWTDAEGRTGCTVALFPEGTVASGEVRGGAPASRELALLEPHRTVDRLDAVVLTGGSAFGLAVADGAMAWCEERGVGFPTAAGPVPIVVGLALFDLVEGGSTRPGAAEGTAACVAASAGAVALGRVGAGAGCTVGKWRGREHARPGGLGGAVIDRDGLVVAALVAVNAVGDLRVDGEVRVPTAPEAAFAENTTIGVVATNAILGKADCLNAAQAGHDGLARALDPAHTGGDGDAIVVAATGAVSADAFAVRQLAAVVVERAVYDALDRSAGAP